MSQFRKLALAAVIGTVFGTAITLTYSAVADKEQAAANNSLPIEELRAFTDVFARIKNDYVEPVSDKKLIEDAINGMLSGLDPHSSYLDKTEYKDLQVGTSGEFGGLGIEVGQEDGFVKVVAPIEDTPAYKAGIKPGDLIIKIDDTPVKGMSLNDAVNKMRGKPGTPITLTLLRKGVAKPFAVTLTRAIIKVKSVKYQLLEPNYGYVRITQFQEHTGESLAHALEAMGKENKAPLKGVVLDLRNDPGGLLNSAVGVAAAFLKPGALVVYTKGRAPDSDMRLTASPQDYLRPGQSDYLADLPAWVKTVPVVVLVNGGSASASEIVSGALKDQKRAVVMGTRTFGKGSVQTILPLDNGTAIRLTTAQYFTPSGRSIQAKGIVPDIEIEDPNVRSDMLGVREANLEHHLKNPNGDAQVPQAKPEEIIKAPVEKTPATEHPLAPGEIVSKNDFFLNQALNLLKGVQLMQNR